MTYEDGTIVKIGHIVQKGSEKYLVIGLGRGNAVKLLQVGIVQKDDSPSLGEIVFLPQGFTDTVPNGALTKVGYARITIVDEDPVI